MSSGIPIDQAIPNWGAETLQGFDLNGVADGKPLRGSRRQFVRFYRRKYLDVQAIRVKENPKTGEIRVLESAAVPVEREFVEVITPGDKNTVDTFASDFHRREFWPQYKAFREGRTAPIGMPIDECSFISSHVALELRYHGCHTVEQLADGSDLLVSQIPCGWEIREYAKSICKANLDNKSLGQVNALRDELGKAQTMIKELQAQMKTVQQPAIEVVKRGPGRPPKEITVTE